MIFKHRDSKKTEIEELTSLLTFTLPDHKRFLVERELRFLRSGDQGEKDSSYFIDFYFGTSENWAVLHDLRLEHRNHSAQIDHLLISRFLEFYILETKSYAHAVKVTETGEFLAEYQNKYLAFESPIEQNKRHQIVLKNVMEQYDVLPSRLGLRLKPTFKPYVLVSAKSRLILPKTGVDVSTTIKADTLASVLEKEARNVGLVDMFTTGPNVIGRDTLRETAQRLASLHRPIKIDYRKRFGITDAPLSEKPKEKAAEKVKSYFCFGCK